MERRSVQPRFWAILVTFILAIAVIACGCDFSGVATGQQNAICDGFEVASATGFPFGPLDITVHKKTHSPSDSYWYYYEIDVQALQKDKPPLDLGGVVIKDPKPTKTVFAITLPIDQNAAQLAKAAGGHYVVEIYEYYSYDANHQNLVLHCVNSKNIDLAPPKHKNPPQQATPTFTPAPAQGQPPPPPPQNNPPQVTPCPPGYQGDPANGKPCIQIPR